MAAPYVPARASNYETIRNDAVLDTAAPSVPARALD